MQPQILLITAFEVVTTLHNLSPWPNLLGPAAGSSKVIRGGSFMGYPDDIGVAHRGRDRLHSVTALRGFRCTSSAAP